MSYFPWCHVARSSLRSVGVAAVAVAILSTPAAAQSSRELAARLDQLEQSVAQIQAQTAVDGSSASRILRLQALLEELTGRVEEANFRLNQVSAQLKTLQDDLQYRVAVLEQAASGAPVAPGAQIPGDQSMVDPMAAPAPNSTALLTPGVPPAQPPRRTVSGDEPLSQPVASAPRASRPVSPPAAGVLDGTNADGSFVIRTDAEGNPLPPDPSTLTAAPAAQEPPPTAPAPVAPPRPGAVAAGQLAMAPAATAVQLPDGAPKAQYDYAFDFLRRSDFGSAEVAFREFLKQNPKDELAGNAQYWLGETYYVRGDFQQAAVEFMAGYQNYPRANKGPDSLLKLAMAMSNLGQTQGACTALNRLAKDYPKAPAEVQKPAAAERAKLKCK